MIENIVEIRRINSDEAARLTRNMTLDDTGEKTMEFCLLMSTVMWAGFIRGELACLWGVIPPSLMSNQAYAWLNTQRSLRAMSLYS